jgi:hypothetical protein
MIGSSLLPVQLLAAQRSTHPDIALAVARNSTGGTHAAARRHFEEAGTST